MQEQIDGIKLRHAQEILELQNNLDEIGLENARLQKVISSNQSYRTTSPLVKGIVVENEKACFYSIENLCYSRWSTAWWSGHGRTGKRWRIWRRKRDPSSAWGHWERFAKTDTFGDSIEFSVGFWRVDCFAIGVGTRLLRPVQRIIGNCWEAMQSLGCTPGWIGS